jgi:hypothetical protein
MPNKVIYVRNIDEKFWDQAKRKAGDTGMGAYLMRLVRRDQSGLWQKPEMTPDEKMTEGLRLIAEARDEMPGVSS